MLKNSLQWSTAHAGLLRWELPTRPLSSVLRGASPLESADGSACRYGHPWETLLFTLSGLKGIHTL